MCRYCNGEAGFRCVKESKYVRLVERSRYCGCSIEIVEMRFERRRRSRDSMNRFGDGVLRGG
jgi:hypothetical protein